MLEETINAERYKDILLNKVIPVMTQRRNQTRMYQQDGAPPRWARQVREVLNSRMKSRWIGRDGPIPWPPRSPDLSVETFSGL